MIFLVTGGRGFVGSNNCLRLLKAGMGVVLFDNSGRIGAARNLAWLREQGLAAAGFKA